MIKVTMLSGPHVCQTLTTGNTLTDVEPVGFMINLARHQWRWEVDQSNASSEESLNWARADLIGRVFTAAIAHRAVRFMGARWDFANIETDSQEANEMIGEIEDSLVDSGRNVGVLNDDWVNDLVIGVRGYEKRE